MSNDRWHNSRGSVSQWGLDIRSVMTGSCNLGLGVASSQLSDAKILWGFGIVLLFVYICKFEVDALNSSYSQLDVFKSCVRQVGFYLDPLRELSFGISPYPFFILHELDFCKFKVRQTCFLG